VRVFLHPTGLHSRAMVRVANALAQYAPPEVVEPVADLASCDLQILHVINQDAISYAREIKARGGKYAVIQYCFRTAGGELRDWLEMWRGAEVVWSYLTDVYTLARDEPYSFYYAPLGVDEVFHDALDTVIDTLLSRYSRIITTGYVSGPGAEPIEETWRAADLVGLEVVHLGPRKVEGTNYRPARFTSYEGINDTLLAELYATSTWVSGLRHVEGFELPAAEGLVCGACPIVFDQPGMREWYGGLADFVSETSGEDLVNLLARRFEHGTGVLPEEREEALRRFNWETIAKGFWEALLR